MIRRFWLWLTDRRTLTFLGFALLAASLLMGVNGMLVAAAWAGVVFLSLLLIWVIVVAFRHWKTKRAAREMNAMLEAQANKTSGDPLAQNDLALMRTRMLEAINTIKTSKLGLLSGKQALYELPWYMVIGNPAAGKSTAILHSGLQFPLADKQGAVISGVGGTRNCDWFFTTDGIFLDTAGRYAVHEEDRNEWFGFLKLLKKHRPLAPINGIIIAVSIPELVNNKPEFGIQLAKNLRQRVQELTERLEVFAPVYVMFTKVDRVAGFGDFFAYTNEVEKDRVWGATKPYQLESGQEDVVRFFDDSFDELYDGLKHVSLASLASHRGGHTPAGVFTFPLEFSAVKPALRSFIATLFEENPFQFKPVFRGFYFSSAVQENESASFPAATQVVGDRFHLQQSTLVSESASRENSFFLLGLFRNVICQDKQLVSQYASQQKIRLRQGVFAIAATLLGLMLGAWSLAYIANQQLTAHVQADLDGVVKMQQNRIDLQSRLEALVVLQSRIEQLEQYRDSHPWNLGFGLYQGEALEQKLRQEYFHGIKEVLLKPVKDNVENYLAEVSANPSLLKTAQAIALEKQATNGSPQAYQSNSTRSAEEAYNALKTYLMLNERARAEPGHLNDQLARFWRTWLESNRGNMSRDQMISSAEKIISFYLAQISDPLWPVIDNKPALVDTTRETLRQVMHGMPARERIYAEVKARAATRFPAVTVARVVGEQNKDLVAGSYAVSGAFTREAWEGFIRQAFKDAATKEQQSSDWVLKTNDFEDLTLEGSPEQIRKLLMEQYKQEYTQQWKSFIQGVAVVEMKGFDTTVEAMNRLGDPQSSPLLVLMTTLYDQTSWDNPSLVNAGLLRAKRGVIDWFRQTILRQSPASMNVSVDVKTGKTEVPMGPIGREFAGIAKLIVVKDGNTSLMGRYLQQLSKVRSRFNVLNNQGDPGPGAKVLMEQTLDGNGSELSDSLKFVDEQMMVGLTETQKQTLRPILVRPLIQAFAVIVKPAESEVNRIWQAQVYAPFQKGLAAKYPFNPNSTVEADGAEIAQIFGSEGAISKFFTQAIGGLVVRRGDTLNSKTWADMGVNFSPAVVQQFTNWVAPLSAAGVPASGRSEPQWAFQMLPGSAPGTREYTIEIDGQVLRYRNTQAEWKDLVWPNPQGVAGAKITAITFSGQTIEVVNFPGKFGFKRLMDMATHQRKANGVYGLSWEKGEVQVTADLKIISKPEAVSASPSPQAHGFKGLNLPSAITAPKLMSSADSVPATTTSLPPARVSREEGAQ